ncbi:MAG: hypothetical protein ABIW38_11025 [Ferruginibacter sp.]
MTTDFNQHDTLISHDFERPVLPSGLNVLTILTFIGSALQLIGGLFNFYNSQKIFEQKDKMIAQMNSGEMPAFAKSLMGDPAHFEELATKSFENRLPILIITLVAAALCIVGALQMRQLKKQGYLLYVIGELLPFLSMVLFIGLFSMSGVGFMVGAGITLIFIVLYTTYRKNLVY